MPTYEYKCEKCGKIFEEFQSISAEPLKDCIDTECGGSVQRLLSSGAGFLFKGTGFYQTDYRSDSYKKAANKDKPSTDSGSSKSDSQKSSASSTSSSSKDSSKK